jgi:hypothetical protein
VTGLPGRIAPAVTALAVVVGGLLLVWAAASGPIGLFRPAGRPLEFDPASPPEEDASSPTEDPVEAAKRSVEQTRDLSLIGDILAWTVLLGLLAAVCAVGWWLWRKRHQRPGGPLSADFEVLPEVTTAEALEREVGVQLVELATGAPRNAIVRCWVALETAVADAGLPRQRHETSSEFVVRALHRLDLDPAAVGRLAARYREARFSEHPIGEDARQDATSALEQIHADLRRIGAAT